MRRLFLILACSLSAFAQNTPDAGLWAEIQKIPAIDDHTHVMKVTGPGEKDTEFDALPCEVEAWDLPVFLRPDRPEVVSAWKALYGYKYNDQSPEHVKELVSAREKLMQQQGDEFPTWVLDHINTNTMFANRIAMGRGLAKPRFEWVPYDDALLFPLNNRSMANTPDRRFFYDREEHLLFRYLQESRVEGFPATLDEYVARVVVPTLERQKRQGAVAIKFEVAYLRALDFASAEGVTAAKVYEEFVRRGAPDEVPSVTEYKRLQDYLFYVTAQNAGRLGLPIHIHTGTGCGRYFQTAGSNPLLMESFLNDPALNKTTFVFLHGAWPYTEQMAAMLLRPNVYTDTSAQTFLVSQRRQSESIRQWLETMPEKVMFGTDAYAGDDPQYGWDTVAWQTSHNARYALALALTGMMQDGEVTREQALRLAHLVLHGNAEKLYGFK